MSHVASRRRFVVTAAAAAGLLLAACSDSPEDTTAEEAGGESPAARSASEQDPATIRVAELSTANYLTLGRASGVIDDALAGVGAEAEWLGPFSVPTAAYETVYAGQSDAGSTGASRLTVWAAEQRDIVAIAVESYSGDSQGLAAAPGSGVTELEDLYDGRVAVGPAPGGTGDYIFEKAFENAGLDSSRVEKVYIADTDAAAAFATGEIDAWSTYDQFFATAQATDDATVLARGDEIGSHNVSIHFVGRGLVEEHPVAVRALYDGLAAQAEAAAADPSIITDSYAASGAGGDITDVIATFDVPVIEPLDADAVAGLEALAEDYVRYGFIDAAPDLSTVTSDVTTLGAAG